MRTLLLLAHLLAGPSVYAANYYCGTLPETNTQIFAMNFEGRIHSSKQPSLVLAQSGAVKDQGSLDWVPQKNSWVAELWIGVGASYSFSIRQNQGRYVLQLSEIYYQSFSDGSVQPIDTPLSSKTCREI